MRLMRDTQSDAGTFGILAADAGMKICDTLEPPWRNNATNVSCIPEGRYPVAYRWSEKHGRMLWHIDNVPGRGAIEIHIGNTVIDTDGCVLVGAGRGPVLCKDGVTRPGVLASHGTFDMFMARDPEFTPFVLVVVDAPATLPA